MQDFRVVSLVNLERQKFRISQFLVAHTEDIIGCTNDDHGKPYDWEIEMMYVNVKIAYRKKRITGFSKDAKEAN